MYSQRVLSCILFQRMQRFDKNWDKKIEKIEKLFVMYSENLFWNISTKMWNKAVFVYLVVSLKFVFIMVLEKRI